MSTLLEFSFIIFTRRSFLEDYYLRNQRFGFLKEVIFNFHVNFEPFPLIFTFQLLDYFSLSLQFRLNPSFNAFSTIVISFASGISLSLAKIDLLLILEIDIFPLV